MVEEIIEIVSINSLFDSQNIPKLEGRVARTIAFVSLSRVPRPSFSLGRGFSSAEGTVRRG
jgi:hypothetical protein